jgi:DNA (cytosine-5)-methyltransferase 1
MEVIKAKHPPVVFLENVKFLQYHDNGRTLKIIIESLESQGYFVKYKVLNAKDFGVAQNRERIYFVASKDKFFNFELIPKSDEKVFIKDILDPEGPYEILDPEEYTIIDRDLWTQQESGLIFVGYRNKKIRKKGVRPGTKHLSRVHSQPNRIYHINGTHPTLPAQESSGRFWIYNGEVVRKLTIKECFRLMGFPNDFISISTNSTLYHQIGNSVAIPVVEAIAKEIRRQLLE